MLTTIAFIAAAGAPLWPPAGSYRYTASLNGAQLGTSTVTVKADGGNTEISETASGEQGGLQFAGTSLLVLGADLAPTQYTGAYTVAGQPAKVSVTLTPTTATVSGSSASPQTFALDPNAKHFVVIEPGLLSGIFALPAQMRTWNDAAVTAIAPAYGRAEGLPADPSAPAAPRPANVPATDQQLSLGGSVPLTIWYDPATMIPDEIDVPSQAATVTRVRD